jgi:hypothetical protein
MSKHKSIIKFNQGDRVAEKPKASYIQVKNLKNLEIVKKNSRQRFGTVLGYVYQANCNGNKSPYIQVQWDHLESPSLHAQSRLCLESDLDAVKADYCNSIAV